MLSLSSLAGASKPRGVILVVPNDVPVQLSAELLAALSRDSQVELVAMPSSQISSACGPTLSFDSFAAINEDLKLFGSPEDERGGMTPRDFRRLKKELLLVGVLLLAALVMSCTGCQSDSMLTLTSTYSVGYKTHLSPDEKTLALKLQMPSVPPSASKLVPERGF